MHFYAWKKGLKTGMYYLRSTAAANAIQFTLDKATVKQPQTETVAAGGTKVQEQDMAYQAQYEQNKSDMACSLDNPDACEACGS